MQSLDSTKPEFSTGPNGGKEGVAYILVNESMPDFIKVGFASRSSLIDELRAINDASIPMPFQVYFAATVRDRVKLERTIEFIFGEHRVGAKRDFLRINPDLIRAIIELSALSPVEVSDEAQGIAYEDHLEMSRIRAIREQQALKLLHAREGTLLRFVKDRDITCRVVDSGKVLFEGKRMDPAAAALSVMRAKGYEWDKVFGGDYWTAQDDGLPSKTSLDQEPVRSKSDVVDLGDYPQAPVLDEHAPFMVVKAN